MRIPATNLGHLYGLDGAPLQSCSFSLTALRGRDYHCPHFTGEEPESRAVVKELVQAQRSSFDCKSADPKVLIILLSSGQL